MESGKYIPNCKEEKAKEIESFFSSGTQGRFLETVFVNPHFGFNGFFFHRTRWKKTQNSYQLPWVFVQFFLHDMNLQFEGLFTFWLICGDFLSGYPVIDNN